ncbi:hypothetical protein [Streptomyces sp. NPDC051569]|uniref:hypothetical protein n=1 Tax=Streptomyces sp. NPDC051569 TaxID=3365661 RepID=UPI00379242A9
MNGGRLPGGKPAESTGLLGTGLLGTGLLGTGLLTADLPAEDLLETGAVLPLGGTAGDVLTARAYGHPALDDRTVVRLVPGAIGAAEDLALEYLGFGGAEVDEVGRVRQRSLSFPAWALVHDPANGHHALAVVKEMERLTRLVATKPGLAMDGFDEIGDRLDRSVPGFLPTFYEQVGRLFLAVDSSRNASVFFGKARAAEQRHALAVDEERLREVFLEFAAAGALSGKALREHAKALTVRLSAAEAFGQFRAVSLERCAAGLAPYAGMLEDLRRLAKGAGLDVAAEEGSLLAEIMHTGAMNRAAASFWKSALPSLTALAARDRTVRERLLTLFPVTGGDSPEEFDASWLALLDRCGAVDMLMDGSVPAAEWLSSWAAHRQRGWRSTKRLAAELALLERLAERLSADGTPVRLVGGHGWRTAADLDLLDACLASGVPVDGPPADWALELAGWLSDESEGRRDLVALTTDPRFIPLLRAGVERIAQSGEPQRLDRIAGHPALRTALVGWFGERADDLAGPFGLPELGRQLGRMTRFSTPSLLAVAPEAVARITAIPTAPVLARTLRAGIFDELGWPALEEALPELGAVDPKAAGQRHRHTAGSWYQLTDAWPALLVRVGTQVAAVGPTGVIDQRVLTPPKTSTATPWDTTAIRYAGGQWLIAQGHGDDRRALWSGRPAEVFTPVGELNDHGTDARTPSLALPDGGRCYGGRPVYAGDTSFAAERRQVASDGISLWVLHEDQWWEYDPESARRGRVSLPAFFDSALAGGRGQLVAGSCRLLPVQPGLESSPFGTENGLLGWWVLHDPEKGTLTACSVDGSRSPAVSVSSGDRTRHFGEGVPVPPLRLPGGAVLHPRESRGYETKIDLYDAEGVQLAHLPEGRRGGGYAAGSALVPPLAYWHALRPRDEAGSAALRTVTDADAQALLTAVTGGATTREAVRRVLPEITHPALVAGVAGLVDEADRQGKRIGVLAERAARRQDSTAPAEPTVLHAHDGTLSEAFRGFVTPAYSYFYQRGSRNNTTVIQQILALPGVLAPGAAPGRKAVPGPGEQWLTLCGTGMAALALRAASPVTSQTHRAALLEFLDTALGVEAGGDAVLIDPRGRLRTLELRIPGTFQGDEHVGEVRHAGARRLVLLGRLRSEQRDGFWQCVEYDPAGVFGGWDGCTLLSSEVLGAAGDQVRAPAVRRLLELVRERGPLPYHPENATDFADQVGITPAAAALLQLGYRSRDVLTAEYLEPLGAKNAEAQVAVSTLAALTFGQSRAFTALLLPGDPARVADLWSTGFATAPLVERWVAARGRRRPTPPSLFRPMTAETADHGRSVEEVLNPEWQPQLTGRTQQRLVEGRPAPVDPDRLLTGNTVQRWVAALRWLAYRLPYGDPLRAVLPLTLGILRERLADPGLLLDLGVTWDSAYTAVSPRLREAYGLAPERGGDEKEMSELSAALVLTPMPYRRQGDEVWVRPAAVLPAAWSDGATDGGEGGGKDGGEGGPDHPDLKLLVATARAAPGLEALRTLLSEEFTVLVSADGPAGSPQDPSRGAPGPVRQAAERFGLSEDAAAVYLMLLALPDPTDRNQAAWTGWKPARLKKARAELAATELVVKARRARAGRSLFLPGGWLEQRTPPRLPAETWKTVLLPWDLPGFVVPDRPVPELYEAAWRRVADGDRPGFEEFQGRTGRRGRR